MKVLVACEESQEVCKAFRALGHEAYSCDIQDPSGGHPEWHILGDALKTIEGGQVTTMDGQVHDVGNWDLLIAHPPCYIVKQDNVFAHGETLREAMEALRDKLFEDMPEDERIDTFLRETDREKAYPTQYFYDWHHRLTGSCDMGRKQFARDHGVDLEHGMMTLTEFLELTKDAYGGDVIRKVISKMQEVE